MTPKESLTAEAFHVRLADLQSDQHREKIQRYFKTGAGQYAEGDRFIGVRMGDVFKLAQEFVAMPLDQIEALLESDVHEARAGAVSIMARQFRAKKTGNDRRQALYDLFLARHDRINNWDLVDLGAWHIIGGWLRDKPRDTLYHLARSPSLWERRTAILATLGFLRDDPLDDHFALADMLLDDSEELIHKAVGWVLRETGKKDKPRLLRFIDANLQRMPRTALRAAIEPFDKEERKEILARPRR